MTIEYNFFLLNEHYTRLALKQTELSPLALVIYKDPHLSCYKFLLQFYSPPLFDIATVKYSVHKP